MFTLIVGGAASGKSAWSEARACVPGVPRAYVATMRPQDDECRARVARHRAQRAGRGFSTLECPVGLARLVVPRGASVLLDDVGNLVANELFDPEGLAFGWAEALGGEVGRDGACLPAPGEAVVPGAPGCVALAVAEGARALLASCVHLTVVSNEVCADGARYGAGTRAYLRELAWANRLLAREADVVVEMVAGVPNVLKGEL